MKHHNQKVSWGGKALFDLYFPNVVQSLGRNLETEAEQAAEAIEGAAYWLAPYDLFSLLSYRTQVQQLRSAVTQNGLSPPSSITY